MNKGMVIGYFIGGVAALYIGAQFQTTGVLGFLVGSVIPCGISYLSRSKP